MNKQLKADLYLFLVAIIWGSSYVFSKAALATIPTFTFLTLRFATAFIACLIISWRTLTNINRNTLKYSFYISFILFASFSLQIYGLKFTTASKSGFITSACVIFVPLLEGIIYKKIPEKKNIVGIIFSVIGIALLTLNGKLSINYGDTLTLIAAVGYALQIVLVDYCSTKIDTAPLATLQMGIMTILYIITTFFVEKPVMPTSFSAWGSVLYTGVLGTAICYAIQNVMQKHTTSTHCALIFSFQPASTMIFAFFILGEVISTRGIFGAILIFIGMVIPQLNFSKAQEKKLSVN